MYLFRSLTLTQMWSFQNYLDRSTLYSELFNYLSDILRLWIMILCFMFD